MMVAFGPKGWIVAAGGARLADGQVHRRSINGGVDRGKIGRGGHSDVEGAVLGWRGLRGVRQLLNVVQQFAFVGPAAEVPAEHSVRT